MILALAGLAAALQSAAPPPLAPFDNLPPKAMRKVVEACGFTKVWVGRDKAKLSVVRVSDTIATDDQLTCAAQALDTTFYLYEFSPELISRFAPIRAAIARPRQLAQARARFAKEPARGAPPERAPKESNMALAKRVEAFCGPIAQGALMENAGQIKMAHNWLAKSSPTPDGLVAMADAMGCVMQAALIADLPIGEPAG